MIPKLRKTDDFFPAFFSDLWQDFPVNFFRSDMQMPAINVVEHNKDFSVEIAAPGLEKGDFKVKVDKNILLISAEKEMKREDEDKEKKYLRREFGYTSFSRSFVLPEGIDAENISAKQKDGVIEITLPKKEGMNENRIKEIEIK